MTSVFAVIFFFHFNLLTQKNKVICPACLENLIDGVKGRHAHMPKIRARPLPTYKQQHGFKKYANKLDPVTKNCRFVSSVDVSRTLYRVVICSWMCSWKASSEGRHVKVGEEGVFFYWIAPTSNLESDLLCAGRPKACASHDTEQRGRKELSR